MWYHVLNRGNRRANVFHKAADYDAFVKAMADANARLSVDLLDQGLEQELELADLDLAVERVVGPVDDGDGQRTVVTVALEQVDDAGVFDLTLADADLELAGAWPVSRRWTFWT